MNGRENAYVTGLDSGGLGLFSGTRSDKPCPLCVRWLREWNREEA